MNSISPRTAQFFKTVNIISLTLSISLFSLQVHAQISNGGKPASFHSLKLSDTGKSYSPKTQFIPNKSEVVEKQCTAYKFGETLPFGRSLNDPDFGTKTIDQNGNSIWQATITSENALALGLYFSDFYLPKGAELFIYSPDKTQIIGSFGDFNNSETGLFATELILGDKLIIEYNEPASVAGLGHFKIDEVLHAYRGVSELKNTNDFGDSGGCEVNVNCSEGANYEKQKNSVVRLSIREGDSNFWCTGSVINNTNVDRKPYIITADHCAKEATVANLNQWIIYFNYQSASCANPSVEPGSNTMTGASKIAASSNAGILGSDFYLVLLNQNIPIEYNAYFMGWDRTGDVSNSGATIHHPQGDIKKISTYTHPLVSSTYSSGSDVGMTNAAWEVFWSETTNGHGVTEGGSSGSPLYSRGGYFIGTLTGGGASCSALSETDYYGKFNYHWDQNGSAANTQLKPWLDPIDSGILYLSGVAVGIEEIPKISNDFFTLFPNPSNGLITLRFNESENGKTYNIRVSNMLGQFVYSDEPTIFSTLQINLQHLQKGIYFMEVTNETQGQSQKISIL